jgi:hypothetical protein
MPHADQYESAKFFVPLPGEVPTRLRYPSLVSSTRFTEDQNWKCSKKDNEEDIEATKGEQSYKGRLVALKLLPLCYEEKYVVSFYKAMHGHIFHIFLIWHIFQKSLIVLINNFTPSCVIT